MVWACSPLLQECGPHTGPILSSHGPIRGQHGDPPTNKRPGFKDAGLLLGSQNADTSDTRAGKYWQIDLTESNMKADLAECQRDIVTPTYNKVWFYDQHYY